MENSFVVPVVVIYLLISVGMAAGTKAAAAGRWGDIRSRGVWFAFFLWPLCLLILLGYCVGYRWGQIWRFDRR
jgi:hypothetical protein